MHTNHIGKKCTAIAKLIATTSLCCSPESGQPILVSVRKVNQDWIFHFDEEQTMQGGCRPCDNPFGNKIDPQCGDNV